MARRAQAHVTRLRRTLLICPAPGCRLQIREAFGTSPRERDRIATAVRDRVATLVEPVAEAHHVNCGRGVG